MAGLRRRALAPTLLAALVLVAAPLLGRAVPVEATSWIDAPLDGAILPVKPYQVVAHSADQAGIAEVILEVDGSKLDGVTRPGPGRLVTTRFAWSPPGPGTYVLTVRARSSDDHWGAPATATVIVSALAAAQPTSEPAGTPGPSGSPEPGSSPGPSGTTGPGPTTTAGPTPTPGQSTRVTPVPSQGPATPAPTAAPTAAPTPSPAPTNCTPAAPVLVAPADFYLIQTGVGGNPPTFEWAFRDPSCSSTGFHVIVTDVDGALITDGIVGPSATTWTPPGPLPFGRTCTTYSWTVWSRGAGGSDAAKPAPRQLAVCP